MLKVLSAVISLSLFAGAAFILAKSQSIHAQTLNEIQQAVTELKNSNAADHAQTVKYINCVLVGVTNSPSQTQALAVYQECLAISGA